MNTFKQRLKGNKIYRIAEAFFLGNANYTAKFFTCCRKT